MAQMDIAAGGYGGELQQWLRDVELAVIEDETVRQANAIAQTVLRSAAEKVASVRAAAEVMLAEARAQAELLRLQAEQTLAQAQAYAGQELAEAHAEAGQILFAAHAESARVRKEAAAMLLHAESIFEEAHEEARASASQITGDAQDHRDLLLTATLERIAGLTSNLMGMADQVIAFSEDPAVARAQLAQFMLALTETAEEVEGENGQPPDLEELERRRRSGW